MLDVRRLQALHEIAAAGSFSGAAAALGYTQSAVSQQIAALERETGLHLLDRGTRPVSLTEAGRALLSAAEPIFGHMSQAEQIVAELAEARAVLLRLAAFPSACSTIVPEAIALVRSEHPDTDVRLVEEEPGDAARLLKAGRVDLAVAYTYAALDEVHEPGLEEMPLFDEALLLVLPKGHRLVRHDTVSLRDLATERWIVPPADGPSGAYRLMLMAACHDAGFEPRIAFEIEDTRAAEALVAESLGVALMPELALKPITHPVVARRLDERSLVRRVWAWTLPGRSPAAVTWMRRALDAAAASSLPRDQPSAAAARPSAGGASTGA